jgi:hypothetical protein
MGLPPLVIETLTDITFNRKTITFNRKTITFNRKLYQFR